MHFKRCAYSNGKNAFRKGKEVADMKCQKHENVIYVLREILRCFLNRIKTQIKSDTTLT